MQLLFEGKTFRPGLPFLTAMAPELEDGRWLKTFSESEDEAEDTDNESEAGDSGSECATDSDGDSGSECETETAGVDYDIAQYEDAKRAAYAAAAANAH